MIVVLFANLDEFVRIGGQFILAVTVKLYRISYSKYE